MSYHLRYAAYNAYYIILPFIHSTIDVDLEPCEQGWVHDECASGCPPTCSNPSPGICLLVCEPGCRCEDGLLLDENTGDCVDPKNCTGMAN